MNKKYIKSLIKAKRYGKVIHLINNNVFEWSENDFIKLSKMVKNHFMLYHFMSEHFVKKEIIWKYKHDNLYEYNDYNKINYLLSKRNSVLIWDDYPDKDHSTNICDIFDTYGEYDQEYMLNVYDKLIKYLFSNEMIVYNNCYDITNIHYYIYFGKHYFFNHYMYIHCYYNYGKQKAIKYIQLFKINLSSDRKFLEAIELCHDFYDYSHILDDFHSDIILNDTDVSYVKYCIHTYDEYPPDDYYHKYYFNFIEHIIENYVNSDSYVDKLICAEFNELTQDLDFIRFIMSPSIKGRYPNTEKRMLNTSLVRLCGHDIYFTYGEIFKLIHEKLN